jgi:hypothetical protein
MDNKKCNGCGIVKPVSEFGKEKRAKNGYKPRCKKCYNEYYNSLYTSFKERKTETSKKRYAKNKEKILAERKVYYSNNKKKIIDQHCKYVREQKIKYPYLVSLSNFRGLVKKLLNNPEWRTFDYLGYSFSDLLIALGKVPEKNEHIDHKVPISWFVPETELKIIFDLRNLQILKKFDNESKGNKFCHEIPLSYYTEIIDFIKPKYIEKLKYYGN